MIGNNFLKSFKKKEKELEKDVKIVVEVDKKFLKKLRKRVKEEDNNMSRLTRRLWRQFIQCPELKNDHIPSVKPKSAAKAQRVTLSVPQELHKEMKAAVKAIDESLASATRHLWVQWFKT